MRDKKIHSEEAESLADTKRANMREEARQGSCGHEVQDRFRGKDIIDPSEAIFRIICSIEVLDVHDKAAAYYLICGHRLRYIGYSVWETVPDNAPPFPPDTPEEFLSSFETANTGNAEKRYTRHEIFSHMIDELKAMDLDTLARVYHVFYGDKIASYHGDENRGFFIIDKDAQPERGQYETGHMASSFNFSSRKTSR